ncbi:MAG: ROK family protein, partial [Nitriliruptorales bacterium]
PGLPVGVGVAGVVGRDGTLNYAPNLDLTEVPLAARLHGELGVATAVKNDATVALYGEHRAGAARDARDVVMLTLGTGVGGAVLVDGRLVEGAQGMAGELGHIPVRDGGRKCPCGNRGCLEAYASGTAIGRAAQSALEDSDRPSSLRDVETVDGKGVTDAALAGDELARDVMADTGYWLGVGLVGIVNTLDPELVVVGGGAATAAWELLLPVALEVLEGRILGAGHRPVPELVPAELGDDAGAIGAALVLHDDRNG